MVTIRLHNTMTRSKELFTPIDPANVRMYVCGPTVYDRAHLGNARPVVVFDVLFRLLRHVYGEGHVTYVRNFTDVDDKINARAAATGRDIRAITDETIGWYHDDMAALGALPPTHEPRATEYIGAMIGMIEGLISSGHAYVATGHVLFAVESYGEYGRLSGRSIDDMIAGARVEVAPYKRNPMDFVLWKPSSDALPGWPSPWGRGRPGWHIECSAMSHELLGAEFDIHGGGLDLQFPHHENEIAQSRCAHPEAGFARVWMHNEMLVVDGKKMSKSLGNFFTVRELLDQGVPGRLIRMVMLLTHYSKPMDWTEAKFSQVQTEMHKWSYAISNFRDSQGPVSQGLVETLANDLNTPEAITHLRSLYATSAHEQLAIDLRFLGVWDGESPNEIAGIHFRDTSTGPWIALKIEGYITKLDQARREKKFTVADAIRSQLKEIGVVVKTSNAGTGYELGPDFDLVKLEALT